MTSEASSRFGTLEYADLSAFRVRPPWAALLFILVVWVGLLPISLTLAIPSSKPGPVGDGSSIGYEYAVAAGVAHGNLVLQRCRRLDNAGLRVSAAFAMPHILPFDDKGWPVRTLGIPLTLFGAVPLGRYVLQLRRARQAAARLGR